MSCDAERLLQKKRTDAAPYWEGLARHSPLLKAVCACRVPEPLAAVKKRMMPDSPSAAHCMEGGA
jgi:hypothetical protein